MTYTVQFRGGPLGGEVRSFEGQPPMKLEVPAMRSLSVIETRYADKPVMWDTETYYLIRSLWPNEYEYRWENPNQSLLNKITKLEEEVKTLTEDNELIEALRVLKAKL